MFTKYYSFKKLNPIPQNKGKDSHINSVGKIYIKKDSLHIIDFICV